MRAHRCGLAILAVATILAAGATARAVRPQTWTHQSEADYSDGQFDNTIVNNYGELTLGRAIKPMSAGATLDFVNAFAQGKDGTIYFATSPGGKVYKIVDGKAVDYYTPAASSGALLSMATDSKGNLLVGAGGKSGQLLRLTEMNGKATATTLFKEEGVDYIWTIKNGPDGALYLGTGPDGKVWRVTEDGKANVVLETGAKNVLSITFDAKGNVVAGTDVKGLVIRVDKDTQKPFVLLDAGAVDITGLVTDKDGTIYAAAATSEDSGGPSNLESGPPSKPGKVEPDTTEPEDDMPDISPSPNPAKGKKDAKPDGATKAPATQPGGAMITLPGNGLLGDANPPLPPEVMALIDKMRDNGPQAAATKKNPKPKLPVTTGGKSGKPTGKPRHPVVGGPAENAEEGNAVYRIGRDDMVTTILREPDMMLALAMQNGELLVGTGGDGKLYSYDPATQAETLVVRVPNENVMALFAAADGTVYCGTLNEGGVYLLGAQMAEKGTFTSAVQDAEHTAQWGAATLRDGARRDQGDHCRAHQQRARCETGEAILERLVGGDPRGRRPEDPSAAGAVSAIPGHLDGRRQGGRIADRRGSADLVPGGESAAPAQAPGGRSADRRRGRLGIEGGGGGQSTLARCADDVGSERPEPR